MIVVSDTSPITNLIQISRLELLRDLFEEIIIPPLVFQELSKTDNQKEIIENAGWIKIKEVVDKKLAKQLLNKIDAGEAEAIALAIELKAEYLLIDELKGRSVAKEYGIQITGVLGTLLKAKEKGFLSEVKIEMDKLIYAANFRIHPNLYHAILELAGE